jgi:hypothetical protein
LVVIAGIGFAVVRSAGSRTSQAQPAMPDCAWPGALNAAILSQHPELNISNPDTAAAYWIMAIPVQNDLQITLAGRYPESRYMSFAIYDESGTSFTVNGVSSTLTDYQIAPDPASVNPWQQAAPAGGQFTVRLQSDATGGQINTLPLTPSGTSGGTTVVLYLRVYVPANDDPGQVPLPVITVTGNGVSRQLPTCPTESQNQLPASYCAIPWVSKEAPFCQSSLGRPPATPVGPSPTGEIVPFANPPAGQGGTPDKDIGYLSATVIRPQTDDVLVVHAKAPTTPAGATPRPWPAPGVDVRYWSLCIDSTAFPIPVVVNTLPDGRADFGCRYDGQVQLDRDGYYTLVIGTEDQRAGIEAIPGATFLPFSTTNPSQAYKLNLRNMLANSAFAEAIQNVPANGSPASAAAAMGPYYPRMGFCSLATLAASGPTVCATASPLPSGDTSVGAGGILNAIGGFFRHVFGSG